MSDYKAAFNAAATDISAIIALLGFSKYPGVEPVLRAITDLVLTKAEVQALRDELARINSLANCGSVQNWLTLSDEDKAKWFELYCRMDDQNVAMHRELEALRKDKARLDRLDQLSAALNAKYGTTYRWQVIVSHNVNRLMLGKLQIDLNDQDCNGLPSCRDALDTIMPHALLNEKKEPDSNHVQER